MSLRKPGILAGRDGGVKPVEAPWDALMVESLESPTDSCGRPRAFFANMISSNRRIGE